MRSLIFYGHTTQKTSYFRLYFSIKNRQNELLILLSPNNQSNGLFSHYFLFGLIGLCMVGAFRFFGCSCSCSFGFGFGFGILNIHKHTCCCLYFVDYMAYTRCVVHIHRISARGVQKLYYEKQ